MTTDKHVSTFHVYFDIDDVDTLALLAIIAKHHFPIREWALLCQALLMCLWKIALWISVGVDDWATEKTITTSNDPEDVTEYRIKKIFAQICSC